MLEKLKAALVKMGLATGDEEPETLIDAVVNKLSEYMGNADRAAEEMKSIADKIGIAKVNEATAEVICKAIDAMQVNKVDATQYRAMSDRVAALEQEGTARVARDQVDKFILDGRLNPHDERQIQWAMRFASTDVEGFRALMEESPQLWKPGRLAKADGKPPKNEREAMIRAARSEFDANKNDRLKGFDMITFINGSLLLEKHASLDKDEIAALTAAK